MVSIVEVLQYEPLMMYRILMSELSCEWSDVALL